METTTIRLSQIAYVPVVETPIFRNRKDWRRYQVLLKRMRVRMEADMLAAILGPGPYPAPPTSYPPRSEPRGFLWNAPS